MNTQLPSSNSSWTSTNSNRSQYGNPRNVGSLATLNANMSRLRAQNMKTSGLKTLGTEPFPYRPPISDFESGRGYMLRVLKELEYGTAYSFFSTNSVLDPGCRLHLAPFANSVQIDIERLASHMYLPLPRADGERLNNFFLHPVSPRHLELSNRKVCPQCLKENGVASGMWDLSLLTACIHHKSSLVHKCPACKKGLAWNRSLVDSCNCGYNLKATMPRAASVGQLALTAYILKAIKIGGTVTGEFAKHGYPDALGKLDLNSLLHVIRFLGGRVVTGDLRLSTSTFRSPDLAADVVEIAHFLLSNWPVNFKKSLADHLKTFPELEIKTLPIDKVFGSFSRHLHNEMSDRKFNFLCYAFDEFLLDDWCGHFNGRVLRRRTSTIGNGKWVQLNSVVTEFEGVSRGLLHRLIDDGTIRSTWIIVNEEDKQQFFDHKDWTAWIVANETAYIKVMSGLTQEEAATQLGVTLQELGELLKVGVLSGFEMFDHAKFRSKIVSKIDVDRILSYFRSFNRVINCSPNLISLSMARATFKVTDVRKGIFGWAIQAVSEKRLFPVGRAAVSDSVLDYYFDVNDLCRCVPPHLLIQENELLSVLECCQLLQISHTELLKLVEMKQLPRPRMLPGYSVLLHRKRDILNFLGCTNASL